MKGSILLALAVAAGAAGVAWPRGVVPRPGRNLGESRRDALAGAAARVLARKELDGAAVGIDVRSITRGERIWSRQAAQPFTPASNLKIVTLYLALTQLGPDFEFATPLVASGPVVEGGRLEGDLWVIGSGDPTLKPCFFESEEAGAPLAPFVQALVLQGVTAVRGDLVVDARAFDEEFIPQGWPQDQLGENYAAPVSALSLNGNCVQVRVCGRSGLPPTVALEPEVFGWRVQNDLLSAKDGRELKVAILPPGRALAASAAARPEVRDDENGGIVRVRGTVGGEVGAVALPAPVADPPLFFGLALRAALERAGIRVGGAVRKAQEAEALPETARTLYTRRSPLLPALQICGKESDNTIAEHLLKACALARLGKGTAAHGEQLVRELCVELGVDAEGLRIVDGSGLSRLDQVPPALLTAVLAKAWAAPWRDELVRCLPISGVDGTLEKRMTDPAMQYRVRAKTGYISQVSSLSGYALAGDEPDVEVFAFSIVVNGFKGGNLEMKRVQDDLCRAIVALPRAPAE